MNLNEQPWYILQDPTAPGEHIVLESVGVKLSPLWLSLEEAQQFALSSPAAQGMLAQKLDTRVLKESFLLALRMLGVQKLLIGYQVGKPVGQTADLETLLHSLKRELGKTSRPN